MFRAVKAGEDKTAEAQAVTLVKLKDDLDKKLVEARSSAVFKGSLSLTNAQAQFNSIVGKGGELDRVRIMAEKYRQLAAPQDQGLFAQVLERLRGVKSEVDGRLQELTGGNAKNFPELDRSYLVSPGFIERGGFYADTFRLAEAKQFQGVSLVGDKADKWNRFSTETMDRLRKNAMGYAGEFKPSFDDTAAFLLKRVDRLQREAYFAAYIEEAGRKLKEPLGFPLAKASTTPMTPAQVKEADTQLTFIAQDLASPAMPRVSGSDSPAWQTFVARASTLARVTRAILGEDLTPGECIISLMKIEEATKSQDAWRETGAWRDIRLVATRAGAAVRTGEMEDQKLGAPTVDQRLTLQLVQNVNATDPKTAVYEVGDWGAVGLLLKSTNPQRLDPTTWTVHWPLRQAEAAGVIRLKLKFDRQFPELESWPAK